MRAATPRAILHVSQHALVLICALSFALVAMPARAHAAQLSFSPDSGAFAAGKEFSVKVLVDSGADKVNAADGAISFDKDVLAVTSFSKDGSAFSLWTAEPTFSNSAGTFEFSGGTPSAFSGSKTAVTIKFKPKKAGTAKISFTKGSVLAADGKGTDVYEKGGEASFTITEAPAAEPEPAPAEDAISGEGSGTPLAPIIDSATYAKPDLWYATSSGTFTWKIPPDTTGVRVLHSEKDDQTPTKLLEGNAASYVVTGVKDGTSFFFVQLRNESGWGDIAKRQILVDTVPPAEFDVALVAESGDAPPKLSFKTDDALSGIDKYEIFIGGVSMASVKAKDMTDGAYPVPPQDGGMQEVRIKAYDLAGNVREAKRELDLPAVEKQAGKKSSQDEEAPPQPFWTIERMLLSIFAFVIGGMVMWMRSIRKTEQQNKARALVRVSEMGDKTDRIFSAMREEFEQMIADFDPKPQLTPEERSLLVNIKEVLDMSEELIDTGIDELKKEIKSQQ